MTGRHNFIYRSINILIFVSIVLSGLMNLRAQEISYDEFRSRRENLLNLLDDSSAVVIKSADIKNRNGDVEYLYRQESSFLYLTGVDQQDCYAILYRPGIEFKGSSAAYILFKPDLNDDTVLSDREAEFNSRQFSKVFNNLLKKIKIIYTAPPDISYYYDWLNGKMIFAEKENRKKFESAHPGIKIKNLEMIISKLREIKSKDEIALINKAIVITGDAFKKAVKLCRPGAWEYELRGALEGEMIKQGCDYTAFPSIIGSGPNSLILHYDKDNRQMKEGELIVMDIGGEYRGYAADVTRTIPVSGKFSPAQKEIYSIVLETQKQVIDIVKPGVTFYELNKKALEYLASKGMENYMPHGVSHSVGLDVHDLTSSDTLKAGMVITVEPGLYFPAADTLIAEKYRGFGIRIEDDVLVTDKGCKVLSSSIPKKILEIEALFEN